MLTCLLLIMLLVVFGNIGIFALKATWGLTKFIFTLVFLPLIIVGCIFSGLFVLAIPLLVVAGVASLCFRIV